VADRDGDEDRALLARHGRRLLDLTHASVLHDFEFGRPLPVDIGNETAELAAQRATLVTLRVRGGIAGTDPVRRAGTVHAWRPLLADISGNAFAAAFADRRQPPLGAADRYDLAITVALLGAPQPLPAAEPESALRPGEDGVLVEWEGGSFALYPEAWAALPTPRAFLAEARRRAESGAAAGDVALRCARFAVAAVSDDD